MTQRDRGQEVKLERMLRKVQGLLAQADHPNTSPTEADTFRTAAERLMHQYRIDESMLVAQPESVLAPEWNRIVIPHGEWRQYYTAMAKYAGQHVGVRGRASVDRLEIDGASTTSWNYHYVGYPSDIRVVELLYTSCMLAFQQRLEPKHDPSLSEQENAYNLRRGGMEGWRIAKLLWPDVPDEITRSGWRPPDRLVYKARKLFKLEALKRGEDPSELLGQGNSMTTYRASYAEGFLSEIRHRMLRMRQSRSDDGGLTLAGRQERIDEAYYEMYPNERPAAPLPSAEDEEEGEEGASGGVARDHSRHSYSDPRANCDKCKRAISGYCREHSYLRPRAYRDEPYSQAGAAAGRRAARDVDLGGRSGRSIS